ncbi:MAG TPA: ABC transporter permease [Acidobacteriaceae bacterium]|nr:ABC transporter permease [Acidobacteriaceae bacterium]
MLNDFRFALRQLRKSPGFTLTAVLTLALGIGANTAIFSLVDSIMLRPLPFPQQDRLTRIEYSTGELSFFPKGWIRALGEHSDSFKAISGFGADTESNVAGTDSSDRVFGAEVMTNAFDTLGIHPAVGSFFTGNEELSGRDSVVVLSYGYWQQRFGQNPDAIGQNIRIDGISRRIIGVMPAGVRFPYGDTQFVTPVAFKGGDPLDPWRNFDLRLFGRLKDGVSPAQAQAELHRLHASLLPLFPWRMPDNWASELTVVPLLESEVGATRPRLLLLFGAVGFILLIACANVANLMLARAAGREREMALRGALGASSGRLMQQLLSESVLVGALAGIAGLLAADASLQGLVQLLPADTPRLNEIALHWPVFLFAAAASLLTGFLFGLIPALKMASPNLQGALRSSSRGVAGKASQFRVSMALVMGQIGLSVVVITAAGLLLHSLYSLSKVDPGFRTQRVVTAEVSLDATACQEKGRCNGFFSTLLNRAQGIAGMEAVALTESLPLSGRDNNYVYDAEGHPRDARQSALLATGRTVSPDYFRTLGMRLVRGRMLTNQDESGSSHAVVINQSMAERLWPHQDPLGKHVIDVSDEPTPAVWNKDASSMVVGVVSNTHGGSLASGFGDEVYLPMTIKHEEPVMYVLLRTRGSTSEAAEGLRRVVKEADPLVPVTRIRSLNEVVAASVSAPRSLAILLLSFGALALLIGGVGVYSLIAYVVSWRTREIGIRLALGALRWQIVGAIVKQSLLLAVGGSVAGLVVAALLMQFLRSFLFGVSVIDPVTFCTVPAVMLLLALFAAWLPARRAAGVDPMETLRNE